MWTYSLSNFSLRNPKIEIFNKWEFFPPLSDDFDALQDRRLKDFKKIEKKLQRKQQKKNPLLNNKISHNKGNSNNNK